ncbi:MAG: hypothetical protein ABSB74_06415 [Tepidisphaeraceae bacterium]
MSNVNDNHHDAINSCFGPNAWPHEVIYPELAAQAAIREIDPQQWVNSVVRRIPIWAHGKLRTRNPVDLEDSCQNFCVTMIDDRPDLRYDASKGPKDAFLSRILTNVHYQTLRGKRSLTGTDGLDIDNMEALESGPVYAADQRDLFELVRQLNFELPECERLALSEVLDSTQCSCPTKAVHRVRFCRALQRIRVMADARKLRDSRSGSRRVRFPRTRRVRFPNMRLVGSVSPRFCCAEPGFMASCR